MEEISLKPTSSQFLARQTSRRERARRRPIDRQTAPHATPLSKAQPSTYNDAIPRERAHRGRVFETVAQLVEQRTFHPPGPCETLDFTGFLRVRASRFSRFLAPFGRILYPFCTRLDTWSGAGALSRF